MRTRNVSAYLLLAGILTGFLILLYNTQPAIRFGQFYDDTFYLSVAQALAEGDGFVVPSLPGTPPQTKYPILYPWLLSWVWVWAPAFPENVGAAVALTAFSACWYLIAAFLLLRGWRGVGNGSALAIVAVCAFHGSFVFQSGQVTTEIPFAALMLTSLLCLDLGTEQDRPTRWVWLAGVFAGLCVLTRTAGIAVGGGMVLSLAYRRRYKDVARIGLATAPALIGLAAWSLTHRPEISPDAPRGFVQTWYFYTSYLDFWRISITTLDIFWRMIATNFDAIFMQVSKLTLRHGLGSGSMVTRSLAFMLSIGILAGCVRHARRDAWRPIYFVFGLTAILLVFWSAAITGRVLVAFLPLFYVGVFAEMRHLLGAMIKPFRSGGGRIERVTAILLAVPLGWLFGTGIINYSRSFDVPEDRILLGQLSTRDWTELGDWIEGNLPPETIFLTGSDTYLYLLTGRQAIIPMAFTDDLYYDQHASEARAQYAYFMDVARHARTRYWVVDANALPTNVRELDELVRAFHQGLPEVFRTKSGALRILDLTCILEEDHHACGDLLSRVSPATGS